MSVKVRVLWFLFILETAFAVSTHERVIGGSDTTVERFPFMSNVQFHFGYISWEHTCGGSLISSFTVLSGAKCFSTSHQWPAMWRIRLGTSYASSGGSVYDVSSIIIHPDFSDYTLQNDIAVVRLSSRVFFTDSISPASIAGSSFVLEDDSNVDILGWGNTIYDANPSETLKHVETVVVSQELCVERYDYLRLNTTIYERFPEVVPGMMCTGNLNGLTPKDACHQGDLGGPVVSRGSVVVGIISWAFGCANPWYPGVNTRVSEYTSWIIRNTT